MAGIDKIFGTESQLIELREWLKKNKPEYLVYVNNPEGEFYNKPEKESDLVTISNFPEYADIWLYKNCPIKFVTDRINEQYGGNGFFCLNDNRRG